MDEVATGTTEPQVGLRKGTNWWGAFVIGLAGTILVTGIAPLAVASLGAATILLFGMMTLCGVVLCFCLAELATIMPDRTGGIPSYAAESFKPLGPKVSKHAGGLLGWSYWLGWFPVAPINVILTSAYIFTLFGLPSGSNINPLGFLGQAWASPLSLWIFVGSLILLAMMFVPAYLGIHLGAGFATVLGVLAMVPLTGIIVLGFAGGTFHWHDVAGFHLLAHTHASPAFYFAWLFPISWNVIAMEAAACYIGECREPVRDAKIAMTVESLYGAAIYILTPIVFVGVLAASVSTSDPLTFYTDFMKHIFGSASWEEWVIGIPLIAALLLSVLNAIMGVGRSLYQASEDGTLPRFFQHKNRHGVPDYAMGFNVVCAMIVVLFGSPARIYIFSNSGYLLACTAALYGYFLHRHFQPDVERPFRLPEFFKWIALVIAVGWTAIYFYGGWNAPAVVVGPGAGHTLFIFGCVIVLCYFPLYAWRARSDRRLGLAAPGALAMAPVPSADPQPD